MLDAGDFELLNPSPGLFEKIKFFISGDVHDKILELLKNGGAERMNYFSDYVTHLICGYNAEDTDISDANELYEIPAITPKWIVMCVKLNRILNTKPYIYDNKKLFSNLVFCLSKVSTDRTVLWAFITYNGGKVQIRMNRCCTHLVTIDTTSAKYAKAIECDIVCVTPDWVVECVKQKTLISHDLFHPRLIIQPKFVKHESTTAITGFEPENDDKNENDSTNATQALLEKLKQRMPWNQLVTSGVKDVVPPNVVAPTFTTPRLPAPVTTAQTTPVQQRTPPKMYPVTVSNANPIVRSIVHHTAQGQNPPQLAQFNQATHMHRFQLQQQQQQQQQQHQQRANLLSHINQQQQQPQLNKVHMAQTQFNPPQVMQRQMQVGNQMQLQPGINQIGQPPVGPMQRPQIPQIGKNLNIQQLQQQLAQRQFTNVQQQNFPNQPQIINQPNQVLNQNQQQMILNQNQLGAILNQDQVLNRNQLEQIQNQQQQQQQQQQLGSVINQNQVMTQNQIAQQQQQQQQQQVLVQNHPHLGVQQGKILQGPFVQQAQATDAQQFVHQFAPNQTTYQQQQIVQNPFIANRPQNQFNAQGVIGQQVVLNQQKPMIINQQNQPPQQPQGLVQPNQPKPMWQQQQQQQPPQSQQQQQQQQQQPQPQLGIRHASIVQQGPRVHWSPTQQPQQHVPQRQFIQLDMQTHQQLQQMAPEQRAIFISKLQQKQRQMMLQQRQQQMQMQQRTGHVLIRSGPVPQGLNPQQQMQWLQQQAKQQGVMLQPPPQQQQQQQQQPPTPQPQPNPQNPPPHTPGLSPIQQQNPPQFNEAQLQLQRQQQFRLQQLQLQREQAQKVAAIPQVVAPTNVIRPIGQPQTADVVVTTTTTGVDSAVAQQQQLVVNAKTKTALANMLSIRLQSGAATVGAPPDTIPEPSAAGTLRLMTAQHNAALNSNNRPQEILGLPQRRPVTAPNGEIIRPTPPPSVPPSPTIQNEPPQLQYSPRTNNIPIQHRQGPFYGHNPNLKLPPDLFLLGCIFVVVELDRFLEESIPNWQEQIEKHGGEVEKQYCSRVTHVLCETQRHGVVMQALRDCKRCVTLYWLSDVMRRKQVLPPWTALHLPMMYLDTTPASKHLISLTGFVNSERNRIKHMIKYIGATFTNYLSKHNTLLIAAKAEGPKYAHAKKWSTPVVNVQWLTDVMLGNFAALNQIEHIKYQQFTNPPMFNFEPSLVPSLMHAWKMPINISQESYERVKRSPSPVAIPKKIKKIKVEEVDAQPDERSPTHRILFSLVSDVDELKNIVRELGGSMAHSHQDCTHLVMPYLGRTNKLLHCICVGVPILPESWLRDSHSAHKFLDPSNYSLDTKDFNSEYKCDFNQTLMTRNRNKLFEGKFFYITPSVFPSKDVLTELIQSCGGCVEKHRRTLSQIEATNINSPYSYIVLTHANDLHLVYDILRNKKDKIRTVCNVELIYSAILKQTFEIEPYSVQVCEVRR
ncbi:hypothetical protein FQR65_LT10800 [Abscondita terminalis]|nr:hypothetical protein FQR65_LT10800 [Abscondita terminalis]